MVPRYDIISQGEELLVGQGVDSNAPWISGELQGLGLRPGRVTVVGDELGAIRQVIEESAARAAVVVCTGGLGPTSDDLTRHAAAAAFDLPLEESATALAQIEERYRARARPMPAINRVQALLPRGAALLENALGTAPGFRWDTGSSLLFFLPGVPFEMRPMVAEHVLPAVRARFSLPARRTMVLRCVSLAESVAGGRMEGFERPGVTVGYRASFPEVQVKLHVEAGLDADALAEEARERLGPEHVFGINTGSLAAVVGELLRGRGQTLATAESCTAGRIAAELTATPGASEWFLGGGVVYANAAKTDLCGVSPAMLADHGAVSEAVARALAEGVRRRFGADWGIAVTGIAGPGGGSAEKPVGTVHYACAGPSGTQHRQVRLPYDRLRNLSASVALTLDLLRQGLLATT
jgi:nicotinamide-nucleotide amidase